MRSPYIRFRGAPPYCLAYAGRLWLVLKLCCALLTGISARFFLSPPLMECSKGNLDFGGATLEWAFEGEVVTVTVRITKANQEGDQRLTAYDR